MTNPPVKLGEHGRAFAKNIHSVRKALGISLEELVASLGERGIHVTRDQLIRIEAGQRKASVDEACELARALKTKLNRLVLPSHLILAPNRPVHGVFADSKPTLDVTGGRQ